MKHTKLQPDQQGQKTEPMHPQPKQQHKTRHEQGPKKPASRDRSFQEHEHPETRMTD